MCSDTLQSEKQVRYKGQQKTLPWREGDETKQYQKYRDSRSKFPRHPHSSMLNNSSSSVTIGLLRGLNKPGPFENPRELGTRLVVG
jgi:hypothetical protein